MARLPIHGILLLDKPSGLTSTAALSRAKRLMSAAKAGHTGTLDPMASGLLPLCFGEATRLAADLLNADKAYEATLLLGSTTDTGDAEGQVLESRPVAVDLAAATAVLERFRGEIDQIPPMYSALKRDGKAYYEYARAGVTLERVPRRVTIHHLELLAFDGASMTVRVDCSKGTYIRTLAEDIGAALGCGAHLTALRRTRVGDLRLQDAVTFETIDATRDRSSLLRPLDALLETLPRLDLDAEGTLRFRHGQRIRIEAIGTTTQPDRDMRVYGSEDSTAVPTLIGIATLRADGVLAPLRVIAPVPGATVAARTST